MIRQKNLLHLQGMWPLLFLYLNRRNWIKLSRDRIKAMAHKCTFTSAVNFFISIKRWPHNSSCSLVSLQFPSSNVLAHFLHCPSPSVQTQQSAHAPWCTALFSSASVFSFADCNSAVATNKSALILSLVSHHDGLFVCTFFLIGTPMAAATAGFFIGCRGIYLHLR